MRNLKKILALVLALVMSMSLMATANAFTDDASIDADYETATKVLAGIGVFQGYPDGSFAPKATITRQEVAAIMYRIASADVTDKQDNLFVEGANFTDVKTTDWSAGYIGYCANGGIVAGYGNGKFGPQDQVTGYQVLAMALRAIGYDKNGEFTGSDWAKNVATTAQALNILKNVPGTVQLSQPATRELVAELIFQTLNVPMVEYTPAFGYQPKKVVMGTSTTLGIQQFQLDDEPTADKWGRPGTKYTYVVAGKAKSTTIIDKPIATYTTAVTECDVAHAAGLTKDTTYTLYVNGAVKSNLPVQILDTVDTLGAQGRITEVYKDTIVMIDTFLAKVTATADAKYDKNGHQVAPYSITLTVYDDATGNTVVLEDKDAAFGYTAGDFVLVNAYTMTGNRDAAGLVAKAANSNKAVYAKIVGLAKSEVGAQSVIWYNADKHTVNGNTYDDACEFNKNDATTTTVNYTWYFDQFGNLIGAFKIDTQYDYAVLTKIWWAGDPATGLGKAMGTLKYMDGSENTVEIAKIDGKTTTYAVNDNFGADAAGKFQVATYIATNAAKDGTTGWIDGNLLRVYTNANGAVELELVKDSTGSYHTETTAKVYNKNAYIGTLKVDTATKFLVGTRDANGVYSYSTYAGINEIPSFTAADVVVDYVLNDKGVVKYAYIIGTPDSASTTDHVLITNTGYTATLKTAGGVNFWEVNLYTMEGLVTVKTQSAEVLAELTDADNVNCLYYLTYTDGYATDFRKVTNTAVEYKTNKFDALVLNATYANDVVEADIVGTTDARWNVTNSTVVVGALTANMTGKTVYMLYDNKMNVEKIYVIDVPAEAVPPVVEDPTVDYAKMVNDVTVADMGVEIDAEESVWVPGYEFGGGHFENKFNTITAAEVEDAVEAKITATGVTVAAEVVGTYTSPEVVGNTSTATVKVTLTAGTATRVVTITVTVKAV